MHAGAPWRMLPMIVRLGQPSPSRRSAGWRRVASSNSSRIFVSSCAWPRAERPLRARSRWRAARGHRVRGADTGRGMMATSGRRARSCPGPSIRWALAWCCRGHRFTSRSANRWGSWPSRCRKSQASAWRGPSWIRGQGRSGGPTGGRAGSHSRRPSSPQPSGASGCRQGAGASSGA